MYRIIGPTSPRFGARRRRRRRTHRSPASGVHPVSMKNAVMNPQAMNAAMFGMIIPDRNVPNFWTAILVLLGFLAGVSACAVTGCPFG